MLGLGKKKKAKAGETPEAEAIDADKAATAPDGEAGADGDAPGAKKKLPIKLIAIAAVALLVLGGAGGGGAWFFLFKGKPGAHAPVKAKPKAKDDKAKMKIGESNPNGCTLSAGPDGVVFCKIPDLMTNTATTEGRPHVLSLKITFELPDEATGDVIGEQMPRLQDLLQTFLRELRPEDIVGSGGTFRLRQEIQRRVNMVIAPAKVNSVLIEQILQT